MAKQSKLQHLRIYTILIIIGLVSIQVNGKGSGGQCYSASQVVCHKSWDNLWQAMYERRYGSVCSYFTELHSCTRQYQSQCPFSEGERELFNEDIVQVYTKHPHNCPHMGGDLRLPESEAQQNHSYQISSSAFFLLLSASILLLHRNS